jgi:hypothetical protein
MLKPIIDLPAGVVGLRADGVVIAQDLSQALLLAKATPNLDKSVGFILFVDPDLDGYLAEIVSELDKESQTEPAIFQAEQYRSADKLRIFPQSRSGDALAWVSANR